MEKYLNINIRLKVEYCSDSELIEIKKIILNKAKTINQFNTDARVKTLRTCTVKDNKI